MEADALPSSMVSGVLPYLPSQVPKRDPVVTECLFINLHLS